MIKGLSDEARSAEEPAGAAQEPAGAAQCPRPAGAGGGGTFTRWESAGWVGKAPDRGCGLRHTPSPLRTPARGTRISLWPPPPAALRLLPGPLPGRGHRTSPRESAGSW